MMTSGGIIEPNLQISKFQLDQENQHQDIVRQNYTNLTESLFNVLVGIYSEHLHLLELHKLIDQIKQTYNFKEHSRNQKIDFLSMSYKQIQNFFTHTYVQQNPQLDIVTIANSPNLKIKKFTNALYFGEMSNRYRHGLGIMIHQNGTYYEGLWQNDLKQGKGFQRLLNKGLYYGQYLNGLPEGNGIFKWANSEIYCGEWLQGKKHGSGRWMTPNGDCYLGHWQADHTHGFGMHVWVKSGDVYVGSVQNNLKHGQGVEIFANGDVYDGTYTNGQPNGQGNYKFSNGSEYTGMFTNGLRNGHGLWLKKKEDMIHEYEGKYVNDRKCGQGIFQWANGTRYEGEFYNDKRNGYGEILWIDGAYYKGNWIDGLMNGTGEFGCGMHTFKGVWKNNALINEDNRSNSIAVISLSKFPGQYSLRTGHNTSIQNSQDEINSSNPLSCEEDNLISVDQEGNNRLTRSNFNKTDKDQVQLQQTNNDQNFKTQEISFIPRKSINRSVTHNQRYSDISKNQTPEKLQVKNVLSSGDDTGYLTKTGKQDSSFFFGKSPFTYANLGSKKNPSKILTERAVSRVENQVIRQDKGRRSLGMISSLYVPQYVERGVQTFRIKDSYTQTIIMKSEQRSQYMKPQPSSQRNSPVQQTPRKPISKTQRSSSHCQPKLKFVNNWKFQIPQAPVRKYYHTGFKFDQYDREIIRRQSSSIDCLTNQELKRWIRIMRRLKLNPQRYDNIWDPSMIIQIRQYLYPPIWLPTGQIYQ